MHVRPLNRIQATCLDVKGKNRKSAKSTKNPTQLLLSFRRHQNFPPKTANSTKNPTSYLKTKTLCLSLYLSFIIIIIRRNTHANRNQFKLSLQSEEACSHNTASNTQFTSSNPTSAISFLYVAFQQTPPLLLLSFSLFSTSLIPPSPIFSLAPTESLQMPAAEGASNAASPSATHPTPSRPVEEMPPRPDPAQLRPSIHSRV